MVTDLAEVFRLGTAKAEENLGFRRHLCAHHYADKPFQVLASELQRHVDCTACANCCRHSVVSVNKPEIENIAWHLGTTPEAVARLYTVPDPDASASRTLLNSGEGCVGGSAGRARRRIDHEDGIGHPKTTMRYPTRRNTGPVADATVSGLIQRISSAHQLPIDFVRVESARALPAREASLKL